MPEENDDDRLKSEKIQDAQQKEDTGRTSGVNNPAIQSVTQQHRNRQQQRHQQFTAVPEGQGGQHNLQNNEHELQYGSEFNQQQSRRAQRKEKLYRQNRNSCFHYPSTREQIQRQPQQPQPQHQGNHLLHTQHPNTRMQGNNQHRQVVHVETFQPSQLDQQTFRSPLNQPQANRDSIAPLAPISNCHSLLQRAPNAAAIQHIRNQQTVNQYHNVPLTHIPTSHGLSQREPKTVENQHAQDQLSVHQGHRTQTPFNQLYVQIEPYDLSIQHEQFQPTIKQYHKPLELTHTPNSQYPQREPATLSVQQNRFQPTDKQFRYDVPSTLALNCHSVSQREPNTLSIQHEQFCNVSPFTQTPSNDAVPQRKVNMLANDHIYSEPDCTFKKPLKPETQMKGDADGNQTSNHNTNLRIPTQRNGINSATSTSTQQRRDEILPPLQSNRVYAQIQSTQTSDFQQPIPHFAPILPRLPNSNTHFPEASSPTVYSTANKCHLPLPKPEVCSPLTLRPGPALTQRYSNLQTPTSTANNSDATFPVERSSNQEIQSVALSLPEGDSPLFTARQLKEYKQHCKNRKRVTMKWLEDNWKFLMNPPEGIVDLSYLPCRSVATQTIASPSIQQSVQSSGAGLETKTLSISCNNQPVSVTNVTHIVTSIPVAPGSMTLSGAKLENNQLSFFSNRQPDAVSNEIHNVTSISAPQQSIQSGLENNVVTAPASCRAHPTSNRIHNMIPVSVGQQSMQSSTARLENNQMPSLASRPSLSISNGALPLVGQRSMQSPSVRLENNHISSTCYHQPLSASNNVMMTQMSAGCQMIQSPNHPGLQNDKVSIPVSHQSLPSSNGKDTTMFSIPAGQQLMQSSVLGLQNRRQPEMITNGVHDISTSMPVNQLPLLSTGAILENDQLSISCNNQPDLISTGTHRMMTSCARIQNNQLSIPTNHQSVSVYNGYRNMRTVPESQQLFQSSDFGLQNHTTIPACRQRESVSSLINNVISVPAVQQQFIPSRIGQQNTRLSTRGIHQPVPDFYKTPNNDMVTSTTSVPVVQRSARSSAVKLPLITASPDPALNEKVTESSKKGNDLESNSH